MSTAYTHLESLLLFQALRHENVNGHAIFNRISEQLKSVPLVHSDPLYDPGRLSPDALRNLYLWLVKEELQRDREHGQAKENHVINREADGRSTPESKKRKIAGPVPPTVQDALQHDHLIPQLVTRLYTRYRDTVVGDIRELERRHDTLLREIGEIEAGQWDDRLHARRLASATQAPPSPSFPAGLAPISVKQVQHTKSATTSPKPAYASAGLKRQTTLDSVLVQGSQTGNDDALRSSPMQTTPLHPSQTAPRNSKSGALPSTSALGPSQRLSTQAHNQLPPGPQVSSYPSHHGHQNLQIPDPISRPGSAGGHLPSPHGGNVLPSRSPSHPESPGAPRPGYPQQAQQYSPASGPQQRTAVNGSVGRGYPAAPMPQYYPQQNPYQGPHAAYPQPLHQPHGHPTQPVPPYQATGQNPSRVPSQQGFKGPNGQMWTPTPLQGQAQHNTPVRDSRPASLPYSADASRVAVRRDGKFVSDIISALATPPRQRPVFKNLRLSRTNSGVEVESPHVEPLSPVQTRAELPGRSTRSKGQREPEAIEPEPGSQIKRSRGRPKRDRSPHSVVSSTADESRVTRSQSVSTSVGGLVLVDDRPGSRGKVKIEPSTPAGDVDESEPIPDTSADGPGATRKRRGTLPSQTNPPAKRSRRESVSRPEQSPKFADRPIPRSTSVTAARNFHKTSATIMNDINSHKHASYFAHAVRDKDAPGYSEIIKQPQNLKAIRAAIIAGSRAVNVTASALDSPAAAGTATAAGSRHADATVELDRTLDLIPPKAIVNAAQLEKEVYRMFANAVMFNPGNDGLVADTREMFEDVEAKLAEWRGVEKDVEADGEDGGADEGRGKRRKL